MKNTCLWCGETSIEHSHKQFWGQYNEIRLQLTMLCLSCNNVWFKWSAPDPKCYWRKLNRRKAAR